MNIIVETIGINIHIHAENGEHVWPEDIHEFTDPRMRPGMILEWCTKLCLSQIYYLVKLNKQPNYLVVLIV
jgi:hypothetical protein